MANWRSFQSRIGPRNELMLSVRLNPVWDQGGAESGHLRFGGIKNMNEIKEYFNYYTKYRRD